MEEDRKVWVRAAREAFEAGERGPCKACGKYQFLTHAHHIVPLTVRFDLGWSSPSHDHVWLCPTHHAAAHLLINHVVSHAATSRERVSPSTIGFLSEMETDEISALIEILDAFKEVYYFRD